MNLEAIAVAAVCGYIGGHRDPNADDKQLKAYDLGAEMREQWEGMN